MTVLISRTRQRLVVSALVPLLACTLACALVLLGSDSVARAADDTDGVGISIDVIAPSPSLIPTAPPGRPAGSPSPASTQTTVVDPAQAEQALGDTPFDLGGVLYVSGLTASARPSFNPVNGGVILTFTVKNASSSTFDSSARFWLDSPVGSLVSELAPVELHDLEPDETRTVTATLRNLGQWPVLRGHVTLTPPSEVEGTALIPLTRDADVLLAPLFTLSLLGAGGLGAIGLFGWRRVVARGFGRPGVFRFTRTAA